MQGFGKCSYFGNETYSCWYVDSAQFKVILFLVNYLSNILCSHSNENTFYLQAIKALLATSEGDMRKAITTLQSTARLKGDERITKQDVIDVAGVC